MNDIKGIIEDVEKSSLVSDKVIKRVIEIIGQEEWNDIHDDESDICTTTGELIITLKGIAELERENAELKDYRLTTLAKQQTGMSKYALNLEHKLSWYDDQLTKAKKLLKWFVWYFREDYNNVPYKHKVKEADQFLKENEE